MTLRIDPVDTRRDLRHFIGLPPRLYRGFPGYEPPLRLDRALILDPRKGPFFRKGRVRYWLARRNGQPVGRISAQIPQDLPVGLAPGTGMFGCLDAIDDPAVVAALLAEAEGWLRAEGCTALFGPCLLDMNEEPGLLIEGADQAPMIMAAWHPPYLRRLVEACGYDKWQDLHNWRLDLKTGAYDPAKAPLQPNALPRGFRLVHPEPKQLAEYLPVVCDLYNDCWQSNWGFVPLRPEDLAELGGQMAHFLPKQACTIVYLHDRPVAVLLIIPNMYEISAGLGPDPSPLGWLRLGLRALRPRFRSGRIILLGVSSRLRNSAVGAAAAMTLVAELIARQRSLQADWTEAGWVLENNHALISILERFKFSRNKTFRLFGKSLGTAPGGKIFTDDRHR